MVSKLRVSKYSLADLLFLLYLVTCGVSISSSNALLQNIAYLGFIGLALYQMQGKLVLTKFVCLYGVFLAYSVCSILWSINVANSLVLLRIWAKLFVMITAATMYYTTVKSVKEAMKLIYASLIISCLFVVVNSSATEWIDGSVGKAFGMDTVRFAVKMSFCAYMALYYWLKNRKSIIHLLIMIVFFVLSMLTAKRTGLVFLFVAVTAYLLLTAENKAKKLRIIGKIAITMILLVVAIYSIPILRDSIGIRITGFIETIFYEQNEDESTVARQLLVDHTIKSIMNNPIFGSGVNATRSYLENIGWNHVTYAHNNFLEILSTAGIVGLALFYSNHISAIIRLKKLTKMIDKRWFCFLIAFLVGLLVCDLLQVISESYYEMLLLALLCSGIHECKTSELGV